ncbi:hypothetical protein ILUMI_00229 [Ignelater luminosus]|uniref:Period circadian protein n=1 Tax=Ignelater luminosus TaxID=2038154 RepID=A0A8K0DMA5_IGNLU|nr:hypothetical protein ILUMI_00229 [Ignelater luminosus]
MEAKSETTLKTKISDSAYSNSCSNSNSQRSASSKSRLSGSNSSGSSGYCGAPNSVNGSVDIGTQQALNKRIKDKEHKKKKLKLANSNTNLTVSSCVTPTENRTTTLSTVKDSDITMGIEILPIHTLEVQETTLQNLENNKNATVTTLTANIPVIEESPVDEIITTDSNDERHESENENVEIENNIVEDIINMPCDDPIDPMHKINNCQPEDGFCCVISMYDGVVLYTTPGLTNVLGFPKDMWLGRSFTDFIHPKDRETFSTQITTGVAIPLIDAMGKRRDVKSSLYVCLRKYKGLRTSGYGVVEKAISYKAFHLSVTFRHVTECIDSISWDNNRDAFLVIVAMPVHSSYKVPDEMRKSKKFGMRHTAACIFSHVDADVVMNFGYFPQDMLGKSVFDFYHPEDLPFLKEVYESVMSKCQIAGSVYRSKPYRFAVRNGDFAMIETEWSCFINPWSRKLEFVVGLHRVLQGPSNPDVFEAPKNDDTKHISEEVLKEAKIIREEILLLLNKDLLRPSEVAKHEVSKRCKDLATFMETIMAEVSKSNLKADSPQNHDVSISERDSVMLGEISPHHDYYDRESSSETPPSYNQLNYHENIQRFFKSKPMTTASDESGERPSAVQSTTDTDQEGKSSSAVPACNQKCLSPVQNSGASGSGSAGNLSSGSNPNIESGTTSATNTSNGSYQPPHLTEELLLKHNEDMEKIMRQRHREHRSNFKADRENKKSQHKNDNKNNILEKVDKNEPINHVHGIKRSGSHSWEGDNHKVSKHKHQTVNANEGACTSKNNGTSKFTGLLNGIHSTANCNENGYAAEPNDVHLWPPFSVSMTPLSNSQPYGINSVPNTIGNFPTGMFPVYYIPTQQGQTSTDYSDGNHSHFQVQYMPSMMYNYNPVFPASPLFCPPMAMVPFPMPQPVPPIASEVRHRGGPTTNGTITTDLKPSPPSGGPVSKFQRPASQATSVKAEPGSAIGSVTSGVNRAMSECSRKDIGLSSVCSPDSPLVSPPDGEGHLENSNMTTKTTETEQRSVVNIGQDEESSYSSFYSSFLKTDTGSGSNDDSNGAENKNKSDDNATYKKPRTYPVRKCDPPWLETVSVTPELVYRYQMTVKSLEDILEADMKSLKVIDQPVLVNDQLDQLYIEMELEGLSTKLTLEEGITSSSSSGEEGSSNGLNKHKKTKKSYSSLMMIYEEDAPFPPPDL